MTTLLGVSKAAKTLDQFKRDLFSRQQATATYSDFNLHSQVMRIYEDCHKSGWDGDDSQPVTMETLLIATRLVESLPIDCRTPDISAEPDGNVILEWYISPRKLLNVSIAPTSILDWAALIGDEDPRGSCRFYDSAPETLKYWIGRVYG
jgi:hypothetical protein